MYFNLYISNYMYNMLMSYRIISYHNIFIPSKWPMTKLFYFIVVLLIKL
jgi:hypothetical protein